MVCRAVQITEALTPDSKPRCHIENCDVRIQCIKPLGAPVTMHTCVTKMGQQQMAMHPATVQQGSSYHCLAQQHLQLMAYFSRCLSCLQPLRRR